MSEHYSACCGFLSRLFGTFGKIKKLHLTTVENLRLESSMVTLVTLVCQMPHLHDRKSEPDKQKERGKEMFAVVRQSDVDNSKSPSVISVC